MSDPLLTFGSTKPASIFSRGSAAVFLITVAVWLPSLRNNFVEWDDLHMIVYNPLFNPPTWGSAGWYWFNPAWNLYQPLTTTLWAAMAWVGWKAAPDTFGGHMSPIPFHLAGLLLHAAATVFLFQILQRALSNRFAAAAGALLFAIHPIQTEAVVYAGVLNNPLAGFFSMLAIDRYLAATDPAHRQKSGWVIGSLALFAGLLAKPSAVVVAPLTLILDLAIHRRSLWISLRGILPWTAVAVAFAVLARSIQHGIGPAVLPIWDRPFIAGDAAGFYLAKILWPATLAMDYGRTPESVCNATSRWVVILIPISLIFICLKLRRRQPLITAAGFLFLTGLLPNFGLLPFDFQFVSTTADRYVYLAMAGIALGFGTAIKTVPSTKYAAIAILLLLTIRTELQIPIWQNGQSLYRHALAINPNSWLAASNLAMVIGDSSPDEAIALYHQAIRIRSDRPNVWNSFGSLLLEKGDRTGAIEAFEAAIRLDPQNPTFARNLVRAKSGIDRSLPTTLP